ncbi:hypothetical protein [Corallococcus silvisoli]|uniref:hypothetical protein n=1 Tax=Corallococcus silvisoli TaxID=2697031 RepID=UPI0013775AF3|nr:hypothetical protein [Corallococcus silvisoli]NBD11833.1 hypothetical protein [Corallococcus silvisoli]
MNNSPMSNDPYAFLASLTPEEQQQLMGMGTLDDRAAMLEQQMAQAEALRSGDNREHYSAAAGALSGLSNAANNVYGTYMQKQALEQQRQLLNQKDQGRNLYADILRRQQQQGSAMDVIPSNPFAL